MIMTEIRQVLEKIPQQQVADELNWKKPESGRKAANLVEIPEIFFDKILGEFTLTRVDVQVLLYFIAKCGAILTFIRSMGFQISIILPTSPKF